MLTHACKCGGTYAGIAGSGFGSQLFKGTVS
jgi:hypothetical protein